MSESVSRGQGEVQGPPQQVWAGWEGEAEQHRPW